MGFTSRISKALAVPEGATARYVFDLMLEPGLPVTLVCRHAGGGTPAYERAMFHALNANRVRVNGDRTFSPERARSRHLEEAPLIADHCVVAWENVTDDDGQPMPCTPAGVLELLTAIINAPDGWKRYSEFSTWIGDAANFRPALDDGNLGKASPRG